MYFTLYLLKGQCHEIASGFVNSIATVVDTGGKWELIHEKETRSRKSRFTVPLKD
jgi:hypothetical protein